MNTAVVFGIYRTAYTSIYIQKYIYNQNKNELKKVLNFFQV